uniref:Uncharacterized protein n=1 Tax=Physcomitrium patens TaxID=3218 RepID=A0A2K1L9D2_PHYPA|nr:hypothetical protein PHYPA_001035 [Physcomitrium patens]
MTVHTQRSIKLNGLTVVRSRKNAVARVRQEPRALLRRVLSIAQLVGDEFHKAYSGSRYPGVPFTTVVICVTSSCPMVLSFESPKSATLASSLFVSRMLVLFTSRWMIGGEHLSCRYSNPASDHEHKIACHWNHG